MRLELNVTGAGELTALLNDLTGSEYTNAIVGSLNKAIGAGQTRMAKRIGSELNLKKLDDETPAKYIKKRIKVFKASRNGFDAKLKIRKRATTAPRFMTPAQRQVGKFRNKPGVGVKFFKGGATQTVPGSFLFVSPFNNRILVGIRDEKKYPSRIRRRGRREPGIRSIYGPSLYQIAQKKAVRDDVAKRMRQVFTTEYKARIQKSIAKRLAKR